MFFSRNLQYADQNTENDDTFDTAEIDIALKKSQQKIYDFSTGGRIRIRIRIRIGIKIESRIRIDIKTMPIAPLVNRFHLNSLERR